MKNGVDSLPTLLTFTPLVGILVLLCLPRNHKMVRLVGILATLPSLVCAIGLVQRFNPTAGKMQFVQSLRWFQIPFPKAEGWTFYYSMGVDGLSLTLVTLTCVISTLAAIASLFIKDRRKEYYSLLLLLQVGMTGVFLATNLFLFFLFFEVTLVVTFFLIGIWGYLGKERAANQFLLYNGLGSGFMLFSLIGLLVLTGSLEYVTLQEQMQHIFSQPELVQGSFKLLLWSIFLSLLLAFGIKLPVFPFHSWMLRVHVEAPTPVVMIHSGVLLKMGAYGILRFGVGLFPDYMKEVATVVAILGLINILYGAILAFVEPELKKVLAYSSVSQMGIILLGVASLNVIGLEGALFQAISHGLISALLFFLVGSLVERTKTTQLDELGGLAKSMPLLSGILLTAGMALLGLPGLSGFISEFFTFLGLFAVKPVMTLIATLGLILGVLYTLRAVLKTTYGPIKERYVTESDLSRVEATWMLVLVGLSLWIGLAPAVLGDAIGPSIQLMVSRMGG
jgi:NADH-quinone oxidoreductase subunit M